ncbi:zinc-binding dehydrogenase [Nocardia sp. AG03]|uniref:zinc-binding dehydrogenase n=1 Tax=Nocardia sp. AG03 TaxID=3025312 RepID=UPI0024182D86|nr:zinc-binding dehydrogenase [Nocardia sp. AG03]
MTTGDPQAPTRVEKVDDPVPGPGEVLVRVSAFGVNRGELTRAQRLAPGSRLGWDVLGTIEDDSSAQVQPVLALADGNGWADVVAVHRSRVAVLPDPGDAVDLAALPVAGLTALAAIRRAGPIIGKTVLVTGTSGGVGGVLAQLAGAAGADVLEVRNRLSGTELPVLDAAGRAVTGREVDVVFDSVGGTVLHAAFELLKPHGTLVSTGNTVREPLHLPLDWGHRRPGVSLSYVHLFDALGAAAPVAEDLRWLGARWAAGQLDPRVTRVADRDGLDRTLAALRDREFHGKAVIRW